MTGSDAFVRSAGYVPLTERVLPGSGVRRGVAIATWASLPFVHLAAVWVLSRQTGLPLAGSDTLSAAFQGRVLNAYLTVLTIWAAAQVAGQLRSVRVHTHVRPDEPAADWRTWLLAPVLVVAAFTALDLAGRVADLGGLASPTASILPLAATTAIAVVIRIPQGVAFWTIVVALVAVARIDRLPGTFPEDRTLGMGRVGELLTTILLTFTAAFAPAFLFGTGRLSDLLATVTLFVVAVAALFLAVWRIHRAMAAVRATAVDQVRAMYAAAYRAAQADPSAPDAASLSTAETLVKGAESIHEWPLDDRTQRVAAVVLTGVTTGIVVRLILYALGI